MRARSKARLYWRVRWWWIAVKAHWLIFAFVAFMWLVA